MFGVFSFEYPEQILKSKILLCVANIYIIMHGIDDIVYDYTFEQIFAQKYKYYNRIYKKYRTR